jgi:hypothetical protein
LALDEPAEQKSDQKDEDKNPDENPSLLAGREGVNGGSEALYRPSRA